MLNENNIMSSFMFNADSGVYSGVYSGVRKEGIIKLEYDNKKVKIDTESLKVAVDIGYTIDCSAKDIVMKIDNKTIAIKTVEFAKDLVHCNLANNECAIVTGEVAFKNIVWFSKDLINKTFYYSILTCNSTLSSSDIDYMAKKINKLDTEYLNNSIIEIKNSIDNALVKLEILDADLYQNENTISHIKEEINSIKNIIAQNNLSVKNEENI